MKFLTLLALVGVLTRSPVKAEETQSPLQIRVNTDIITKVFHNRDELALQLLKSKQLIPESEVATGTAQFQSLIATLKPVDGIENHEFDFDLHMSKEYLGGESSKLQVVGSGVSNGQNFDWQVPVKLLKLQYALGEKYNTDMKYNSLLFQQKEWVFDVSANDVTITGDVELFEGAKEDIVKRLSAQMDDLKEKCLAGKEEIVPYFPMDTIMPFVALVYGVQFAQNVEFTDKFVQLSFSAGHFNLMTDKQKKLLKPIKGDFYKEVNHAGQESLAQVLIDDNFFNSMAAIIVSIDKTISFREVAKGNAKVAPFLQMLTTSTIGTVLPQFTEEYGDNKKIDVVFSPSHSLFLDGLPGSKMSGIYMDKNGNWKFQINVNAQVNVETLPDMWDPVRNVYATLVLKMKIMQDDTNPFNKKFIFLPKNIEISQLKVLKGTEEMEMEQMMIQSMANIQFEQAKKFFKEFPISVGDIIKKNPTELQCFGFNVSDLDISFKKSQMQLSAFYKYISNPDKAVCDAFQDELNKSPKKLMDQMRKAGDSSLAKTMMDQVASNMNENSKESMKKVMGKTDEL